MKTSEIQQNLRTPPQKSKLRSSHKTRNREKIQENRNSGTARETRNPEKFQESPNRKMQNRSRFAPLSGIGVARDGLRNTRLGTRCRRDVHTSIVHPERTTHNFLEKSSCPEALRHSFEEIGGEMVLLGTFWIQGELDDKLMGEEYGDRSNDGGIIRRRLQCQCTVARSPKRIEDLRT